MKTKNIIQVLTLALIFTTVNVVNAKDRITDQPSLMKKATIRYEVTVHHAVGFILCHNYLVKVTDANGRPVATPQVFIPGKIKYVFVEYVSVPSNIRIASLSLPDNVDPYFCPTSLKTKSAPMMGPFIPGRTYSFDLYPIIEKGAINEN